MEVTFRDLKLIFEAIIANVPEAIMLVDASSTIVFANPRAEELFGATPGSLPGSSVSKLIPSHLVQAHLAHIEGFIKNGETARRMGANLRVSGISATGPEFPAEATISRIQIQDGRSYAMVFVRDLSGQVAEGKYLGSYLAATSASFDQLEPLDALDSPIVVLDKAWNYLYINPAGQKRLQKTKAELLGNNFFELFPYVRGTEFEKKAELAMQTQAKQTVEEYYPSSHIWYRTDMYPSATALVLQIVDITAHKHTESLNQRLTKTLEQVMDAGAERKEYRRNPPF